MPEKTQPSKVSAPAKLAVAHGAPSMQDKVAFTKAASESNNGGGFALSLVETALDERLRVLKQSIHEDIQNVHLELLRQFHLQQIEMSELVNKLFKQQQELMKEVEDLRRENRELKNNF